MAIEKKLYLSLRGINYSVWGTVLFLNCTLSSVCLLSTSSAQGYTFEQEPRKHALVIGNGFYINLGQVGSAETDADTVAIRFYELGFDTVHVHKNVKSIRQFEYDILPAFSKDIQEGDMVVFYFSGHGFTYGAFNYLAPTGLELEVDEKKVDRHAIAVQSVEDYLAALDPGFILLIIDACRSISGLIIRAKKGRSTVPKSYSLPTQYNLAINTIIAYAAQPGGVAEGFTEAGNLSIFTDSFSDHITKPGVPFGTVYRDIMEDVAYRTENEQFPGIYNWSRTDPYLNPTPKNLQEVREIWLSALRTGEHRRVSYFSTRYSVSRHAAAARRWLADYDAGEITAGFTYASPLAIDRSWRASDTEERAAIRRLVGPVAYPRLVSEDEEELFTASDFELGLIPSGLSPASIVARGGNEATFVATSIGAYERGVATERLRGRSFPRDDAPIVMEIEYGTVLDIQDITFGEDQQVWGRVTTDAQVPVYIEMLPEATPMPLELGSSLIEVFSFPRPNNLPELVDPLPIKNAFEVLQQDWIITWVSLATASTDDQQEAEHRRARLANAQFILRQLGIDGQRMTSVTGRKELIGEGTRIRFFGIPNR